MEKNNTSLYYLYEVKELKSFYLIFQEERSLWKSAVAITSPITGGEGPGGGHATRNARNLLQRSTLYIGAERFGRSIKLQKIQDRAHQQILAHKNHAVKKQSQKTYK